MTVTTPPATAATGPTRARPPLATASLAALFLLAPVLDLPPLQLAAPDLPGLLLAHAVHTAWLQLLLAGGATVGLAAACERAWGAARLIAFLGVAAVGVGLAVVACERGHLSTYVGSSGLGHALASAWLLTAGGAVLGRPPALTLAGLLAGKVGWELASGQVALSAGLAGAVPVPTAHAVGALIGLAAAPLLVTRLAAGSSAAARPRNACSCRVSSRSRPAPPVPSGGAPMPVQLRVVSAPARKGSTTSSSSEAPHALPDGRSRARQGRSRGDRAAARRRRRCG